MIVDLSKWNGDIYWAALAPHVDFAILKTTGDLYNGVDPMFAKNAALAAGYGVPIHAYCFSRAVTPGQAEGEAKRLYEAAMPYKPISYILDLEGDALNGPQVIETANAFISKLRALGARKVGLYTGYYAYAHQGLDAIIKVQDLLLRMNGITTKDGSLENKRDRLLHDAEGLS